MADDAQRQDPETLQDAEVYRGGQPPSAGRANPPDDADDTLGGADAYVAGQRLKAPVAIAAVRRIA